MRYVLGISACVVAVVGLTLAQGVTAAPDAAVGRLSTTAPTANGGRFVSTVYGYSLALPRGWSAVAATSRFPGGDIDHTAPYVDSISASDERLVFVLGRPTSASLAGFSRAHAAWLTENRPCRSLGPARPATLAGSAARVATFTCEGGVYGRTFVVKWTTVRRGHGLIVTQFSPEGRRAADRSVVAKLLRGFSWSA